MSVRGFQRGTAREKERSAQANRRFAVKAAVVCVALVAFGWWFTTARIRGLGPWVDKAEPVTVLGVSFGTAGKVTRSYVHHVRAPDGAEYQMVFGEIFPKGTRIWVRYRRYTQSNRIVVNFYYRCGTGC